MNVIESAAVEKTVEVGGTREAGLAELAAQVERAALVAFAALLRRRAVVEDQIAPVIGRGASSATSVSS